MSFYRRLQRRVVRLSERSKAVGLFFATSLAGRAVGISCQLFQVPIAMQAMGAEAFGLWMTLTSVGYMITFADLGMGQGAQNKLAEAFATGQRERARELWGSTLVFFGAMGLALAMAAIGAIVTVDFTALFNLSDERVQQEARAGAAVTLLLFCLNFPLGLAQRLAYSRQQGWMHNLAQALGGIGALGGLVIATRLHWKLPGIIAATQIPLLLASAGLLAVQLAQLGWTHLRDLRCRWRTVRELFGLGAYFGIQQAQLIMLVALPPVIISTALGAAAVTPYNLAQRFFNLFSIVQNAFMLPLWPAYSDARARHAFGWIRRTLRFSLLATVLGTIGPMALGAFFARPILAFWVGDYADLPSFALVWLLFAWNALLFFGQPFGYLLAGLSEVKRLTHYAIVSTLASAALMALFVQRYAQEGVVVAMIIGFQPFLLLGSIAEARRVLRALPQRSEPDPLLMEAVPVPMEGRR